MELRALGQLGELSQSITVNDLMVRYALTEEDCKMQISDFHQSKISQSHCSKWRLLPCHLGMEKIVVKDVDRVYAGEEETRFEFFSRWKETRGSDATYLSLISALLAIDCREDAESVCKLLGSSLSRPPQP